MQFTKLLSVVSDVLVFGYVITALPLFAGYFLLKKRRGKTKGIISASNALLLFSALVYLLHYLFSRNDFARGMEEVREGYASAYPYYDSYWFSYWGGILLRGIIPLLLFFPRIRNSVWSLLVFSPITALSFFLFLFESLSYGEYITATHVWYVDWKELIIGTTVYVVIYAILLFIIYFAKSFFEKRKLQ